VKNRKKAERKRERGRVCGVSLAAPIK